MIIGKVVGSVISTRKCENLIGNKFMVVEPVSGMQATGSAGNLITGTNIAGKLIAIDNIGAGIGEYVLVALGSAARIGCGMETAPIDAAIVGIIDNGERLE
ncbi:MAG: ethanolamine utilization protein EutN [Herbinix sp.]|jgi:ethanolamine utilization protein EutN|nr:ethanolamine utilization protein EutN [Herbinix sp.]